MKKVLVAVASFSELKPFFESQAINAIQVGEKVTIDFKSLSVDFLITGIGSISTAYHLGCYLSNTKVDFAVNLGIAGSFNFDMEIGQVVSVIAQIPLLEIEDHEQIYTVFDSGLKDKNEKPFKDGVLLNDYPVMDVFEKLKTVKSISSDMVHGNEQTINRLKGKYIADIESMEGAAFFYSCLMSKTRFAEFRAISNYVEPRDKSKWNMNLAIKNLNLFFVELLQSIENK